MRQEKTHNQPLNIPWNQNAGELWTVVSEWQREMLEFASQRLAKDSEALHKIGECRKLEDVSEIQSKWLQQTFRDYSTEATKVMEMVTKHAGNGDTRIEKH